MIQSSTSKRPNDDESIYSRIGCHLIENEKIVKPCFIMVKMLKAFATHRVSHTLGRA